MWMVDPNLMCRKHLLGEHVEIHMFVGSINKGINIQTYIDTNLCEPNSIVERHNSLVKEMKSRGYNHNSPLPKFYYNDDTKVDIDKSYKDLVSRCKECKQLEMV
jgi:hypothetical protein